MTIRFWSTATLVVTYKGAQATRPADEIDVDSFIGLKSHRAKGKRITTYDVDTLSFIEPEEPEVEESAEIEDVTDETMDIADAMNVVADGDDAGDDVIDTAAESSVEKDTTVMVIDPEQLNLF